MNIDSQAVTEFAEHGVVLLRDAIPRDWIDALTQGIDKNIAAPSERGRVWNRDARGRVCLYDSQVWQTIDEYRAFIFDSPIAAIAAKLLTTDTVNFFYDAIFVRTHGMQFRTPFHQDEPYWSVNGFDTCSIWMPLTAVERKSALEFVRGSHKWNQKYNQTNFGALTGDARDHHHAAVGAPFPDIEGNRNQYDIVGWDMQPGDLAVFNGRTIHGGSGNLSADRELKVFNTQWLGDDVRICFRPEGMDPDHSSIMREYGLTPGDRIAGELYPRFVFD